MCSICIHFSSPLQKVSCLQARSLTFLSINFFIINLTQNEYKNKNSQYSWLNFVLLETRSESWMYYYHFEISTLLNHISHTVHTISISHTSHGCCISSSKMSEQPVLIFQLFAKLSANCSNMPFRAWKSFSWLPSKFPHRPDRAPSYFGSTDTYTLVPVKRQSNFK